MTNTEPKKYSADARLDALGVENKGEYYGALVKMVSAGLSADDLNEIAYQKSVSYQSYNPYEAIARKTSLGAEQVRKAVETAIAKPETQWIDPPRDKNGDIIMPGDTLINGVGRPIKVSYLHYYNSTESWYVSQNGMSNYDCELLELVKPDNMERILDDATLHPPVYAGRYSSAKPNNDEECIAFMCKDLVRRTEAVCKGRKEFDWDEFGEHELVVFCADEKEAENFVKKSYENGFVWEGEPSDYTGFEKGRIQCYRCRKNNILNHSSREFYAEEGRKIVNWSDYMEADTNA